VWFGPGCWSICRVFGGVNFLVRRIRIGSSEGLSYPSRPHLGDDGTEALGESLVSVCEEFRAVMRASRIASGRKKLSNVELLL
jgi:hypothetical protein